MPDNVNIGLLTPNDNGGMDFDGPSVIGNAAMKLMSQGAKGLRTLDTLRKDEWIEFDRDVIDVARQRLVVTGDLMSRGLRINLRNGFGTTIFQWEDASDMTEAEITMDGVNRAQQDRQRFDLKSLPVPVIHKEFTINARVLAASRRLGESLDTSQARVATRLVADKIEEMVLGTAGTITFGQSGGSGTIRGYTNHPNRNQVTLNANWNASAMNGELILADVLSMKQALINDRHYGPYVLYIPTAYETVIDGEFKTNSDRSVRERLMAISGISEIKVVDGLTANNVLLVEMQRENVAMVVGQQPTMINWESRGGMALHFMVMAIMVPRLAADQDGRMGIAHLA